MWSMASSTTRSTVTPRASEYHPHLYVNAARLPDRMRMTLAHELGHLVMDAMTLVSPAEAERRANSFAAEFDSIADIGFDLDRVSRGPCMNSMSCASPGV